MPSVESHVRYAQEIMAHGLKHNMDPVFLEKVREMIISEKISSFEDFDWRMGETIRGLERLLAKKKAALYEKEEPRYPPLHFTKDFSGSWKSREEIYNKLKPELQNWKSLSTSLSNEE